MKFGYIKQGVDGHIDIVDAANLLDRIGSAHFIEVHTYSDNTAYAILTGVQEFTREELNILAQELFERFHDAEVGEDELLSGYFDEEEYVLSVPMNVVKELLEQTKLAISSNSEKILH